MVVVRVLIAIFGAALVLSTLASAIKTVVVPRAVATTLTRAHFVLLRRAFMLVARPSHTFERRDRIMALYAPLGLVLLPGVWVVMVLVGFTAMFWASGVEPLSEAFVTSGSSLLTLGFVRPDGAGRIALAFTEAGLGLGLVSLMISYLPTIYGAFSKREALVGMLEVRAGLPPSPVELLSRFHRIGWLDRLDDDVFARWEEWFIDIEESHTSQPALVFFRSPHPHRSWITAAGCVLDTAALSASSLALPRTARPDIVLRQGYLALRRVADFFGITYDHDPRPDDPISIDRAEFEQVLDELVTIGIPVHADRDQAWSDFAGWRVNYDTVLVALAGLVMAPPGMWSSDRPDAVVRLPKIRRAHATTRRPR